MATVRASIEVDAPIDQVFEAWRNFENFPEFMSNVKDVRVDGDESVWVTRVLGVRREWRARTTEVSENRRIRWAAVGDVGMGGEVDFEALSPAKTRVTVQFLWEGDTPTLAAGSLLDDVIVNQDLKNFKKFVEGRKMPKVGASR